jgi:hypothetical protein
MIDFLRYCIPVVVLPAAGRCLPVRPLANNQQQKNDLP